MDGRMLLPMTSAWRLLGAQAVDVPQRKCMVDIYREREMAHRQFSQPIKNICYNIFMYILSFYLTNSS